MPESLFEVGVLAEHSRKAEWGPGMVVKVRPPYVWVYFRDVPGRVARQFNEALLVRSSSQSDSILEHLPAFVEQDGVHLLPSERYTLREAVEVLYACAPEGFGENGTTKVQKDRQGRRAAHAEYTRTLGEGQAEQLLIEGRIGELSARAVDVVTRSRTLSAADLAALREGLRDEEAAAAFFRGVLPFIAAEPTEELFQAHVLGTAAARAAATGGSPWPTLTLLPFLARPDRHMLLQPTVTCPAAQRLGFDLSYRVEPSWPTYEALCLLGRVYLEGLASVGASDLIDVHFFLATLVARPAVQRKGD